LGIAKYGTGIAVWMLDSTHNRYIGLVNRTKKQTLPFDGHGENKSMANDRYTASEVFYWIFIME
jgi:hypothetical protein